MYQLIPYYFVNQLSFTFAALGTLWVILSVYVLPALQGILVARSYISRL
jgi:hypothetical protein